MIYQYHHAPCTIFNYFTLLYFHHTHLKNQTFSIPAPPGMAIVNPQMKQIVVTLNENLTSNEYVMTPRNPTLSLWSARCPVLSGNIFTPFFFFYQSSNFVFLPLTLWLKSKPSYWSAAVFPWPIQLLCLCLHQSFLPQRSKCPPPLKDLSLSMYLLFFLSQSQCLFSIAHH